MKALRAKKTRRGSAVEMIEMSPREAILTIESLARQLATGNCNMGRYECFLEDGVDFSIAVITPVGWISKTTALAAAAPPPPSSGRLGAGADPRRSARRQSPLGPCRPPEAPWPAR